MRIHYAANPETGEWFLGSSMTNPNDVDAFIDRNNLVGFKPTSVDVMDNSWRIVKAAIDNRNNINQINYMAELAAAANASVAKGQQAVNLQTLSEKDASPVQLLAQHEMREARVAAGVGMPAGSVVQVPETARPEVGGKMDPLTKAEILNETAGGLAADKMEVDLRQAGQQTAVEVGRVLTTKEKLALKKGSK